MWHGRGVREQVRLDVGEGKRGGAGLGAGPRPGAGTEGGCWYHVPCH